MTELSVIPVNTIISRLEDMSPAGQLQLILQEDGDICVQVLEGDADGKITQIAGVEFCAPVTGGGKSPRTLKALRQLMIAMIEDNADQGINARKLQMKG